MSKRLVQNESTKNDPVITELPAACADERLAVEFMEQQRWGDKPYCPRCGDHAVYQMKDSKTGERQADFRWRCHGCKQQFTVRIGTVFEDSRAPLRHWCYAFFRAATSKKGVSALELHRQTGLSYKTCLFMLHRIRCAMDAQDIEPMNGTVEIDEVYIGGKPRKVHGKPYETAPWWASSSATARCAHASCQWSTARTSATSLSGTWTRGPGS
jgi:transposase-like protein